MRSSWHAIHLAIDDTSKTKRNKYSRNSSTTGYHSAQHPITDLYLHDLINKPYVYHADGKQKPAAADTS